MTSLFVALILAILIAVFALQNTFPVTVQFLFWQYQTSLVLVILALTAIAAPPTIMQASPYHPHRFSWPKTRRLRLPE